MRPSPDIPVEVTYEVEKECKDRLRPPEEEWGNELLGGRGPPGGPEGPILGPIAVFRMEDDDDPRLSVKEAAMPPATNWPSLATFSGLDGAA